MKEMIGKKILFVSPYFKPHIGGLENYVSNIEKGMRALGWKTVVVTSNDPGKPYQEELLDDTKVYHLPVWLKFSNTPVNPLWYFYLKKIIKKEKPILINGHAPVPFIADMAALASGKVPFVLSYHAGTMKKGKNISDFLISLYENILLPITARKAVKIISPSHFVISSLLKKFEKKAVVISPGVDTDLFKPSEQENGKEKSILFIARFPNMYEMKGLYCLAEAMKKLPQVTLKVIGQPIGSMPKNVIFLGTKSAQETAQEIRSSMAVVLPSLENVESFGMVLIEAMASGKPVIATNTGGVPEVVRDSIDGLLVPPGDSDALAIAIERIVNDPTLAKTLAQNGFEKVISQYSWLSKIKETSDVFLQAINEEKNIEKERPTIVHVSAYYPPHVGGMENVAQMSAERLARSGYDVKVFTSDIGINKENVKILEQSQNPKVLALKSFEFAHTPFAPTLLWHLLLLPKNSIIHFHLAQAYWPELTFIAARLKNVPYVAHFHLDVERSGFFGFLFVIYKKIVWGPFLRGARQVIICSSDQREVLEKKFGVLPEKINVIPNPISESFFSDRVYLAPKEKFRFLYVGRLAIQKKVERLIEMMSLLSIPAQLSIVGDGEDRQKLENLTVKMKLTNVFFEGSKGEEEIKSYHACSDVLLMSSDREGGTPLVAIEAMAGKLPVVGSNVSGIGNFLSQTGVLVGEPYPQEFAKALESLWQSPERLLELSELSSRKAQMHRPGLFVGRIENVYKKI